ncbi:MAG TPA: helix-turn-helix domain-containing protein [Gemmataceae bacterium]|nr:helix-turn-helix domain-containing protein [Gemmataceae bacterium]
MPRIQEPAPRVPRVVSSRWTPALTEKGWTPVSDYFLDNYTRLTPALTNNEALLVIHLMRHKWDNAPPFPGFKTLARRMGMTDTSVRNHARSLERKGYLKRTKRVGTTNLFDLTLLFQALEKLQAYQEGERDARAKAQRRRERKTAAAAEA